MNKFLVVLAPKPENGETIKKEFPEHHFEVIPDTVWAVATEDSAATTADVSNRIGLTSGQANITGIVVQFGTYYGYADGSLWQKLSVWDKP